MTPERVLRDLIVERRSIDRLIPYIRNARTHTEEQVAQVAASIVEFGWTNPILVGADGVIIAGHARLLAARKLGMTEVPVIVLDHLTETQRRALVLADNRLALNAGWDEEMLRVELESLQEDGFNLDIVGFTDEEIEDLLQDPERGRRGQHRRRCRSGDAGNRGHRARRRVGAGRAPVALRRFNPDGGGGEGPGRRPRRYGLHRSTVQRELRRDDEGQAARQEAGRSPTTISAPASNSSCAMPASTCWR